MEKVALVTGGGRPGRVGEAIVKGFAARGWRVIIHAFHAAHDAENLRAALGGDHAVLVGDLADPATPARLVQQAFERYGRLDCLVNSASLFAYDRAGEMSPESLSRHMAINALAPALLTEALARRLEDGQRAAVLNLLDQKVENPNPDYLAYSLSKFALANWQRLMAMAYAPRLRINAVSPGLTLLSGEQTDSGYDDARKVAALGQSNGLADIVNALLFLAEAEAVTGQNLVVDGGQHLIPLPRDVAFLTET